LKAPGLSSLQPRESLIPAFRERLDQRIGTETHDLGFLYTFSCVALWRLLGSNAARETAIRAADLLLRRYYDKVGIWFFLPWEPKNGTVLPPPLPSAAFWS
jgi:hypothetical protein